MKQVSNMAKEISLLDIKSYFQGKASSEKRHDFENEKGRAISFLRKRFSISDDDIEDIYQESMSALYLNVEHGKLRELTCPFSSYFLQICSNQALKFLRNHKTTLPFIEEAKITNSNTIRDDKIDQLYGFCIDTEAEDRIVRKKKLVNQIIASMTETCKDVLRGYYWHDYTTSTIADAFGFKDANSVKTQKYKCAQKFREKYIELEHKIYE